MTKYKLEEVTSSNIAAIGHDGQDLLVRFKNNDLYRYLGASSHFDKMMEAESVGKYLIANVKGKFDYKKEVE